MSRRTKTKVAAAAPPPNLPPPSTVVGDTPVAGRHWLLGLVAIGVVALLLRFVYLFELKDSLLFSVVIGDSLQFDHLAKRIVSGDWLAQDIYYQAQFYPYLLALSYRLFGIDPFAMRIVQAVASAIACVLLAAAGRRFFDARAGLIAGFLAAVYPPSIFFDGLIQKSSPDLLILSVLLAALGFCLDRPRARWLLLAGVAVAMLSWNRENGRILFPVVAVWVLAYFRDVPIGKRLQCLLMFVIGAAAVLLPVMVRNYKLTGEFLLTSSQMGPNFYIGNHHGASGGYEPLVPDRGNPLYERTDAIRVAEEAAGRKLQASEVSDYWFDRAVDDIRRDPASWLVLLARKTWLTFAADEPIDTEGIDSYADHSRVLRLFGPISFGVLIGLAIAGAWLTRQQWRRLLVLYGIFAALAVSVILFFVFARYRFPLVPIAALFAGAGLSQLIALRRESPGRWAIPLTAAVLIGVVLHIPVRTSADETYFNYGSEFLRLGRQQDAITMLREAIRIAPDHPTARLSLGMAYQQTGQTSQAMETFREAIRVTPESPQAHIGLATALHEQGQLEEAVREYREAIRLKPGYSEAMNNLGIALQQLGKPSDAIAAAESAVAARPRDLTALMNYGSLLLEADRTTEAIEVFRRAVKQSTDPRSLLQAEYALAQALVKAGRGPEAIPSLERALRAARSAGETGAAATIEEGLRSLKAR